MVRLGAASIKVSISDADGFRVTHGSSGETIFHKAPELCEGPADFGGDDGEWKQLFELLEDLAGPNLLA